MYSIQKNCEHFYFIFHLREKQPKHSNIFRCFDNICIKSMKVVEKVFFQYMHKLRPTKLKKIPNNQVNWCGLPLSMYVYVCTCTCVYMCRGVWTRHFQRPIPPQLLYLWDSFSPTTIFPSIPRNITHERPHLPRRIDKENIK